MLEKMVKLGRVGSGARVNIFRSEENLYCPATVLQERPQHMKAFFVQYDDGESEWINLWFHKFDVLADAPSRKKIKSSSSQSKSIGIKEERENALKESQRSHNGIELGESKGLTAVPLKDVQSPVSSKPIEKVPEDEGTDTCLENAHDTDELVDAGKDEATSPYVERKHLKRKRDIDDASLTDDKEVASLQEDKGVENHLARKARRGKKAPRVRSKVSVEASNAVDDGEESSVCKEDSSEESGVVIRDCLISTNTEKKSVIQVDSVSHVVSSDFPEESATKLRAEVERSASRVCGTDVSQDVCLEVDSKKSQKHQEVDREVTVGNRVGIYWEGDKRYYYGKVTRHEKGKKKPFFLEYDDGESEWVDFSKIKFRFEKKKVARRAKVVDESTFFECTSKAQLDQSEIDTSLPQPSARTTRRSLNTTEIDEDAALVSDGVPTTRKKSKLTKENDSGIRDGELAEIKVGTRVAVWWPDDRRYYEGVVSKKQPDASWRPFYLEYDDGEAEWIDFRQHKFKILRVDDEEKDAGHSTGKACSDPSKVWIGTRLSVWWPEEEEYFDCTVTRYRDHKRPFYLEYEDGDREWIDLAEHKFFIIESETSNQRRTGKCDRSR
ncbi:hypothetical protein FisN_23Hh144 [Fistulifera solaris]|uniref:Tudor domain-containing protein n=1 Tax=Fistulifera solaris TaxID=1519565 RepID=A0A1Z5KMM3_FISSO|nr:hypothetical protein FisN_23Hh144 [Fistulifera solaris]|eukprot:GAX27397.1 hypothetical protein FisN_23Hh144 [Fistulifera solaris]